ncbi:MAG: hypothetical protein ACRCWJ_10220, partial [Casimicrobium sp.]
MRLLRHRIWVLLSILVATLFLDLRVAVAALNYDIVYLRAPRKGDATLTDWPEVFNPVKMEPGTHLMRLKANGTEEILFDAGANGAVIDPVVSFDAKYVYFAYFPDVSPSGRNSQRNNVPKEGSDIYRIDLATKALKRLTTQQWRPPYAGV